LRHVLQVSPGFATDSVVALRVDPAREQLTPAERRAYLYRLVGAARAVPGVAAVGLTDALPLGDNFGWRRWGARARGQPNDAAHRFEPLVRMIDAGYFATMSVPLRSGRDFTDDDAPGSEPVVIVNETLARAMWPGEDPLGRVMLAGGTERRVVGVVGGVRYFSLDRDVEGEMYMPVGHPGGFNSVDLVVRGSIPPAALVVGVRAALRRADPLLPVGSFRTMTELVDHSVFERRFVVMLVAGFAAFGLLLSALGIYAVVSYSVSQRTREIGIRMALGATAGGVRTRILGETGRLALVGVAVGLPLSWMVARAIRSLLFGVGPSDPMSFAGVCVTLAAVAALAGYLPARRATRVDPAIALRAR
jgi:predicted permease